MSDSEWDAHVWYALAWLSFGLVHSLLARDGAKKLLKPMFGPFYRLSYNIFSALHIGLVYLLGWVLFAEFEPYELSLGLHWGLGILNVSGWMLMLWSLTGYDLGTFGGTKQIRDHFNGVLAHDDEPLHFDGFHRYIRHPLYTAGFIILWTRVNDPLSLATAIWGSLYLLIGSRFEERHLLRVFGDPYATYRACVPAFIPYKGRWDGHARSNFSKDTDHKDH